MGTGDHAFGWIDTYYMDKLWGKFASSGAGAATDIEKSIELAASGRMVINNGFVQARMIAGAVLGVFYALILGVGAKCLFARHGKGSLINSDSEFLMMWFENLSGNVDERDGMEVKCSR
jgi:hypothetical protein